MNFREYLEATAALQTPFDIPRASMPQIKGKHRDAYFDFLTKNGIGYVKTELYPKQVLPSQNEIDLFKVKNYIDHPCETGLFDKRIIISSDNYIVDGHHHWNAMLKGFPNRPINVYKVNKPFSELLQISKNFPKAKFEED